MDEPSRINTPIQIFEIRISASCTTLAFRHRDNVKTACQLKGLKILLITCQIVNSYAYTFLVFAVHLKRVLCVSNTRPYCDSWKTESRSDWLVPCQDKRVALWSVECLVLFDRNQAIPQTLKWLTLLYSLYLIWNPCYVLLGPFF